MPLLKLLALFPEPSFGDEFFRLGENGGVIVDCSMADGYYCLGSDLISA